MFAWKVQIGYPGKEFLIKETKYIHYNLADDEINVIEQRIKQVLDINKEASIYIDYWDTGDTIHVRF